MLAKLTADLEKQGEIAVRLFLLQGAGDSIFQGSVSAADTFGVAFQRVDGGLINYIPWAGIKRIEVSQPV